MAPPELPARRAELFKLREAAAPAADGSLGSPRTHPASSVPSRGKTEAVAGAPQADRALPKSKTSAAGARSGEFAQVSGQNR